MKIDKKNKKISEDPKKLPAKWTGIVQYLALIILVLFSFLLFDPKIAIGGDDAEYIVSARKFLDGIAFPGWHGAFYPIFLSLPCALFGFNITIFKLLSLSLIVLQFIVFFRIFKDRINPIILIPVLFILSVNYFILYNASQTSSEPLYMALQALAIFYFFNLYDNPSSLKKVWRKWLLLGLSVFLLSQTRNIGYSFIIAGIAFLILDKRFRDCLYFFISFVICFIIFNIYKVLVWSKSNIGLESQFNEMFYKDPYNHSLGYDNLSGFIDRFLDNLNFYFSNALVKLMGLRSLNDFDTNWVITIIIIGLLLYTLYRAFTHNKHLFFIILLCCLTFGVTFITQQYRWAQARLMLIILPFFLLTVLSFFDKLPFSGIRNTKYVVLIASVIIFLGTVSASLKEIKKNIPVLEKNLGNDKLYGYTPDYKHYLQASKWIGKNIDKSKIIGCRKPELSCIYSNGSQFLGIYKTVNESLDKVHYKYPNTILLDVLSYLKFIPYEYYNNFRQYFVRYILWDGGWYILFSVPDKDLPNFMAIIKEQRLPTISGYESFIANLKSQGVTEIFSVHPDSAVHFFQDKKIDYAIRASLRLNPDKKGAGTQNAVERMTDYANLRYPEFYKILVKFGDDDDESASVIQFNYDIIQRYLELPRLIKDEKQP